MFLVDFIFPKFCLGCHKIGTYLCPKCQNQLEYFDKDICLYCGRKSLAGLTHPGCTRQFGIDGFLTILKYNQTLKRVIKAFKYRRATAVWQEFSLLVRPEKLEKTKYWPNADFIQPIPLFPRKYRDRGFNQAEIITGYFNGFLKLKPVDWLARKKETKPQAQIKEKRKRRLNLSGAFEVLQKEKVLGRAVILVDDLLTTGDTIKEAGKVLKKAGAGLVFALTLAKG